MVPGSCMHGTRYLQVTIVGSLTGSQELSMSFIVIKICPAIFSVFRRLCLLDNLDRVTRLFLGGAFAVFKGDFGQVQRIVKVFTNYIRVALRQYTNL